jgi:hypothetical protein
LALGTNRHHFVGPSFTGGLGFVGARPIAGNLPGTYALARNGHQLEGYLGVSLVWAVELQRRLSSELKLSMLLVPKPIRHEFIVDESREKLTEGLPVRLGATLALYIR